MNNTLTVIDQDALKSALLRLSPAEKLRVAGNQIRLAKIAPRPQRRAMPNTRDVTCRTTL
jgi:hypothetical protein